MPNPHNPGVIFIAALFGVLSPCSTIAAESKPVPLQATEIPFQQFIASLKAATKRMDAKAVYSVLASNYHLDRDFGGSFDPAASPIQNFSVTFQFDNTHLDPEYKDLGWHEFQQAIAGRKFERKRDGRLCTPHGALDRKPFPTSQLCFQKVGGRWKIQGHINGGD